MWSVALTAEVDTDARLFSVQVCLSGPASFAGGELLLELMDERGYIRHFERRELPPDVLGRRIPLPPFEAPRTAEPDDILGWPWEVAVESGGVELIRWRRYLAAPDRLTAEAEIDLPGRPGILRPKVEEEGIGPEAPWDARDSERMLAGLADDGILGAEEQSRILSERAASGRTVERILIESGLLSECEVLGRYAEASGCEFVDLARYPIDPDAKAKIPKDVARRHDAIAIGFRGGLLTVAMSDPQRAPWAVSDLYACTGSPIYIVVATRAQVLAALDAASSDLRPAPSFTGRDVQRCPGPTEVSR